MHILLLPQKLFYTHIYLDIYFLYKYISHIRFVSITEFFAHQLGEKSFYSLQLEGFPVRDTLNKNNIPPSSREILEIDIVSHSIIYIW